MSYSLSLGTKREGDEIVAKDGAEVAIDRDSLQYFGDSVIEYDDSLSGAGFRIVNANAERSCGCGKSFEPHKKS
jgi:iron-sulfur cluster assembly protein